MVTVKFEEQLVIDDAAAELLNAMTSRRVLREMYQLLPPELKERLTYEDVIRALNPIWCTTANVLRRRKATLRALEAAAPDVSRMDYSAAVRLVTDGS